LENAENDKRKSQYKNSEFNSAWEINAGKPIKNILY
jgi:hypothetical protein